MRFIRCRHLATLIFAAALPLAGQQPGAPVSAPQDSSAPAQPPPHGVYPQIVRLSLVEGDVRIARGKKDEKVTGNAWEEAVADIPLQSGFNLATGEGRAEIEFEDASTIYLAPHSALSLADLSTKDDVPRTSLALLAGTVTLHLVPTIPGEHYLLQTPTDSIRVDYGETSYMRVTGYLDGMQFAPQAAMHLVINNIARPVVDGATYTFSGSAVSPHPFKPMPQMAAWDAWVASRVEAREAAMQSVMHDAGLPTPLPGLADLADQGAFTPCAPYGTCWEPTGGWTTQAAGRDGSRQAPAQNSSQAGATPESPSPNASSSSASAPQAVRAPAQPRLVGAYAPGYGLDDDFFPCDPWRFWDRSGDMLYDASEFYPYDWVVCHTGAWIYREHRWLWAAGTRRHHHCPVRWVKYQGKLAYVPLHPRDEPGKTPLNLRHGAFALTGKPGGPARSGAPV